MTEQARREMDDAETAAQATAAGAETTAEDGEFRALGETDDAETNALNDRIAELEAERDELKKRLMYALADVENIRKRAERERRDAEAYGGTRLARDLLSVHDNLARAMDTADEDLRAAAPAFFEGIDLTQRELLNAFAKHRIETVVPEKGATFDPNLHQAMFEVPVSGAASGTIVEVMQAGFTIAGRLLRPALVGVAKAVETA
jgi:molecular chaperone GrpE